MLKTLTVAQLIEKLQNEDPDLPVIFSTDYGDRCHTAQALPVRGTFDEVGIQESAYSNSGWKVADDDMSDVDDVEPNSYLLIS